MERYDILIQRFRTRSLQQVNEERVSAKFSNTVLVTRLYQSSDPSQPTAFHGNTCAHAMNIDSTERVLPRAPADI
jgi:hypothetical protein